MEKAYYSLLYDILRGYDRLTPSKVYRLRNEQIFVFGTDGSQRFGAAGLAARSFEAEVGVKEGPTGRCYAIPTMGHSLKQLGDSILRFEEYARNNRTQTFLVTAIGCGHAGFKAENVALFFKGCVGLCNVMLPEEFIRVLRNKCREHLELVSATAPSQSSEEDILMYFDDSLHDVVKYLLENNIEFDHDGGFALTDGEHGVVAEAELGVESEKIVFLPYDTEAGVKFQNAGYTIMEPAEYLKTKEAL